MGLIDKIVPKQPAPVQNTTPAPEQLNVQELEFLLSLIKQASFKGEYIEVVYNAASKLQAQYTKIK
jgi:hypothetical protein